LIGARAEIHIHLEQREWIIDGGPVSARHVELGQESRLLDVGQNQHMEADPGLTGRQRGRHDLRHSAGRKHAVDVVVVVQGQANLLQVVLAFQPGGGFANLLDRGE
jgi:hypothetical protein